MPRSKSSRAARSRLSPRSSSYASRLHAPHRARPQGLGASRHVRGTARLSGADCELRAGRSQGDDRAGRHARGDAAADRARPSSRRRPRPRRSRRESGRRDDARGHLGQRPTKRRSARSVLRSSWPATTSSRARSSSSTALRSPRASSAAPSSARPSRPSKLAAVAVLRLSVGTSPPGGGASKEVTFDVQNPGATLTSLSPLSVVAGSGATTLTASGTGFVPGAKIVYGVDGSRRRRSPARPRSPRPSPRACSSAPARAPVTVVNPPPGGGASSAISFTVANPTAAIQSINPSAAFVGSAALSMTVSGSGFVSGQQRPLQRHDARDHVRERERAHRARCPRRRSAPPAISRSP